MSSDRFVLAIIARTIYEEELAKKIGVNPHSAYGRKKLNEYLENQRKSDYLSASMHLRLANKIPGKYFSEAEIRAEALKIEHKRLEPYFEKARIKQKEKEQQKISNSEITQPKITKEKIMMQTQKIREELKTQHNNLCDEYNALLETLYVKSTAKTRVERIQDKVSKEIELEKMSNRLKVLSKVLNFLDMNISLSKYKTNSVPENLEITLEAANNELLILLEKEYKKLDLLSTKKVLINEFKTERLKGNKKYDFGLTPVLGAVISIWCIGIPFEYIANLPFSLVNFLLPLVISGMGGAIGTRYVMKKLTHQKIQAFKNLNSQLGEESLGLEINDDLEDSLGYQMTLDKQINLIAIIIMKQKEYQSLVETKVETPKQQFDYSQHLGRSSVENIINDETPFSDKVLRPVGFKIPKTQSDISWVQPYLEEDIETDETTHSQDSKETVLSRRLTPQKPKENK